MIHCQSFDYISYRGVSAELSPSRQRMHPPGLAGSPTPDTNINMDTSHGGSAHLAECDVYVPGDCLGLIETSYLE